MTHPIECEDVERIPLLNDTETTRLRIALAEALGVIKDCTDYRHNGDPYTENAFDMGELAIHDYVREGRYDEASKLLEKPIQE